MQAQWTFSECPALVEAKLNVTFKEFKVVTLREQLAPKDQALCDVPEKAAAYHRSVVTHSPLYNPDVESLVVIVLNSRRRITGHFIVSTGTLDTILVHPREVFRGALIANAAAVILMHNHPSGDLTPSEADIKVTRDMVRAGQLLKVELLDHVIIGTGEPGFTSLRELGYFYS